MKRTIFTILLAVFLPMTVGNVCFAETSCTFYWYRDFTGETLVVDGEKREAVPGHWRDEIASFELSSCYKMTVYEDHDFEDTEKTVYAGKYDGGVLEDWDLYNEIDSYDIKKFMNYTSVSPHGEMKPGEKITITGNGFKHSKSPVTDVTIGGSPAEHRVISDKTIEVTVGNTGGQIDVYSRYCSFPVGSVETIICPVITSITTEEVLPGETFTINGRDFNDVKNVKVGDEYVDFSVESSTRISATAGEKSGKVTVVTDKCEATSTQDIPVPGAGFIYYDIAGNEIDSGDQNLIEKNAVKRVDKRQRKTDYALEIGHDFSESGLSSGYMENFGNPNPEDGKHWIQSGEEVMIRVDTMVYEPTRDTRHITKGYILSLESSGTFKEQEKSFSGDLEDEREFTLTLDGPKKVFFLWKTEYSFQVMSMPAAMGDNLSPESGTYWYDIGEDVTSSAKDGCLKIEGYRDSISALIETVVADETTISGIPAQEKTYTIDRPVQITWQYEAHNYEETVIIGNSVTLSNVPKSVLDRADIKSEPVRPTSTDPSQAEQGAEELHYWSVSDKKLFPLIGGRTFQVEWKNKSGEKCEQKLITTIHTEWPDPPHYVHVAETPPVPLDPYGNDKFAFKSLKYSSNEAQVSSALEFTSSKAGKSTLLFTKVSSGVATGDMNAEPAYVRVVDTRTWTTDKETASAEIGKGLTSEHHDKRDPYANASPHTGYLFHEHARYNVNVYDRATLQGQIFPVNRQFTPEINDDLVVIWYRFTDHIFWPWKPVHYECQWPGNTKRVVIASREGSECKGADGIYQTWPDRDGEEKNYLDPARYKDVMIYQQPDPTLPGYNPNEEHAVATASFRHGDMPSPPVAAFGLRDDLNITAQDETHTSENYVLLQYYDLKASNHEMEVFDIVKRDYANGYKFEYEMKAGDLLTAPYPLNKVIGAAPPSEICGRNGDPAKNCYWEDHKGQSWAVSGDAHLFAYFWYPLAPEFWYEKDHNGNDASEEPGDPIPWLPDGIVTSGSGFPTDMNGKARAVQVRYNTKWPEEVPVLKAGETVTFAGGEYRADHPQTRQGLPMVLGWAAGQVIFDDLNPKMEKGKVFDDYLVRLVQTLEERTVDLPVDDMPEELQPAAGRVTSVGGRWYFKELHTGLKTRVFYDPLLARKDPETGEVISIGKLGILGFVNGKTLGDDDLTASPPSVYVLQPNILTEKEKETLKELEGANTEFKNAVAKLYNLTRDPADLSDTEGDYTVGISDAVSELSDYKETLFKEQFDAMCGSLHSLCPSCGFDEICADPDESGEPYPFPGMALGPGLALVPSAALLDPASDIKSDLYVTVAENNHPSLGSLPVALHVIKVVNDKYRGAIKTIDSDNVFDEKITLRHTADFGANPEDVVFEWYYREEDGTEQPPYGMAPAGIWQVFPGKGPEVAMTGAGSALLRDNLFFCRYRHRDSDKDKSESESWSDWAGAANSRPPKEGEDASETYQAQLAEGWVKRVVNGLNPFEARINDFYSSDSPATYTSMIRQAGQRFEGAVAFNPDKDVIENIGLIELYQTVLNRAEDLSIRLEQPDHSSGIYTALLLAASRIAGFYTLLGNEAYTDALDPTIGFGTDSVEYGSLAPTIFTFMNQIPNLLDEELALLRGRAEEGARPAYNRLLWNFTKAEGEAAYALSYNLTDVNRDGFIDEADGRAAYPQGHGDAWGHYLTALKGYYDLMGNKYFKWDSRSELFQIEGVVMDVDYFDERKFAETAAAKAKVGMEVVDLTYRSRYVENPDGQWQGYRDTDENRAWGLEEWGQRAGTAAFYDWIVANAILPSSESFKLTEADMKRLEREKVPLDVRNELLQIQDKGYATEDKFMEAVRTAINKAVEAAKSTASLITEEKALEYADLVLEISANSGLKRIDRTTVLELLEIASQARQIQQKYDEANTGLNPLGLATDSVPFDIDPARTIPGTTVSATHFEQVYERAMAAMENAQTVFDHASDLKNRIRQVANSTKKFNEQVLAKDRHYRNELIEILGTPYEGTIGSGKVFPAGYKGPDYFLYMYIDVNEVSNKTVPPAGDTIKAFFRPMNRNIKDDSGSAIKGDLPTIFSQFFAADHMNEEDVTKADFSETLKVAFPMSANKYSFSAPAEWGVRKSPGKIQISLLELVKAEADLQLALADYAGLMADITIAVDTLEAQSELNAKKLKIEKGWVNQTRTFDGMMATLKTTAELFDYSASVHAGVTETIIEGLPKVAGTSTDPTYTIRSATKGGSEVAEMLFRAASSTAMLSVEALESGKEVAELSKDINIMKAQDKYDIQQQLKEIEGYLGNEAPKRLEVFSKREHMRQISEKFRCQLERGLRMIEERKAYNAKVAAKTQGKRYMDMAFRLNLNDALSKYRSMFDLASRYSYLAAKAYDYETNLSDRDPASAKPLLTDIVKQRTLGQCEDGRYVVGRGGLGDILARMEANFASLKGQMGFNNPQTETGRFSLRHELFRIKGKTGVTAVDEEKLTPEEIEEKYTRIGKENDEEWHKILQQYRVEDLWAVPEFRRFCRPFTQEDAGFQPGLVIPFSTNVIFGKNFFGWPLGGGDHAYDPTNFATKVRSVGLWFDGYDNSKLSETPRAYLIPAGMDVMLVPNSTDLDSREWTVVDQKLPVPLPVGDSDLNNPDWIPSLDSLDGPMTQIRRYSSFRAYHDSGYFDANQMSYDSRLIGRSVWNSRWVLIIPGGTFHYDTNQGLDTFIDTVTDIKLFFQTYAMSGGKK